MQYIVRYSRDCRDDLRKVGTIVYEPKLALDFVIFETNEPQQEIEAINGVTTVYEDKPGHLCI